jgi:hypothetical protein
MILNRANEKTLHARLFGVWHRWNGRRFQRRGVCLHGMRVWAVYLIVQWNSRHTHAFHVSTHSSMAQWEWLGSREFFWNAFEGQSCTCPWSGVFFLLLPSFFRGSRASTSNPQKALICSVNGSAVNWASRCYNLEQELSNFIFPLDLNFFCTKWRIKFTFSCSR